ncbi:LolA family protein [Brumimicrobium sp.]|uniref:LolA family protein n=1 Tax=Brumimicrobium sp. TaxID=2029867 RepID=UPI002616D7FC|nr:outer membrane lipoprotein carrier protein LolA [uncultured Brumimicrobium sp.]
MMKYIVLFCTLFTFSLLAQETKLTAQELSAFKQRVEQETKSLKSIRTDFEQSKHMAFLSNDIQSKGKMYLRSDGSLKWEYTSPNVYSVIFKNNSILINDNGKKSTVSGEQDMFKKINHLISGSVSGKLFDDKEFNISYYKSGKNILVKLIPNNKTLKKYISEVNLYFPQQDATVSKVKLIEPSGDFTLITFINKELNVQIDPSIFNH